MSWSCIRNSALGALLLALLACGAAAETITIKRNGVTLREGPGNYFPLVSVLSAGTSGEQTGEKPGWLNVVVTDETGWISSNALSAPPSGSTIAELQGSGAQASGEVVPVEVLVASIKGLTAERNANLTSESAEAAVQSAPSIRPGEHRRYRSSLTARPVSSLEGLPQPIIAPSMLAMMPVLAAEEVNAQGGYNPEMSGYATMILLYACELNGMHNLAPQVYVTETGSSAYSYPGGYIVLGGELMELIRDEAELAAIVTHELTHVIMRHGEKSMKKESWRTKRSSAFSKLEEATAEDEADWPSLKDDEFFATAGQKFMQLRDMVRRQNSIGEEYQADSLAVFITARMGYDPAAMKRVLERVESTYGDRTPGSRLSLAWLSSHDELRKRIAKLDGVIARARQATGNRGGDTFDARFRRMTR
jgi:uncharacterized protein YraI